MPSDCTVLSWRTHPEIEGALQPTITADRADTSAEPPPLSREAGTTVPTEPLLPSDCKVLSSRSLPEIEGASQPTPTADLADTSAVPPPLSREGGIPVTSEPQAKDCGVVVEVVVDARACGVVVEVVDARETLSGHGVYTSLKQWLQMS